MGDPHREGRRVTLVELGDRLTLVYKPRPLAAERVWQRCVAWIGSRTAAGPFLLPRIVDRHDYGWVEHLPRRRPASDAEARRYHYRVGVLVALFDVLAMRDVHRQNLIAVGDQPVLLDAEAIAHPGFARFRSASSLALTGFLPSPSADDDRAGITAGLPRRSVRPIRYVDELLSGFREGYAALRRRGTRLMKHRGPLSALAGAETRVVLRATEAYRSALEGGNAFWPPPDSPLPIRRSARAAIVAAERRDLSRGDVPIFHARADSTDLLHDGEVLAPSCFRQSGTDDIADRLERMSPVEERAKVEFLRAALALDELLAAPDTAATGKSGRRSRCR